MKDNCTTPFLWYKPVNKLAEDSLDGKKFILLDLQKSAILLIKCTKIVNIGFDEYASYSVDNI